MAWADVRHDGTVGMPPAHCSEPKVPPMNASRIPGLVLPVLFLLALTIGLLWYLRHRGD